jgi:hypothetical protein
MSRDLSPEERLLSLIKGKRKEAVVPESVATAAQEQHIVKEEPTAKETRPTPQPLLRKAKPIFNIAYLYIAAGVVLLSVAFTTIITFSNKENKELRSFETILSSISEQPGTTQETKKTEPSPPPLKEPVDQKQDSSLDTYQKIITQKNIFAPPVADKSKPAVGTETTLSGLAKDLRLVGIIPGDDPQAIIEDKKNSQTLFLKIGERIGEIEIKEISNGKVVLGYNSETVTLSL